MAESKIAPPGILLDIEGTVVPISYVYETLFPYARLHGPQFIRGHWNEEILRSAIAELGKLNEADRAEGAPALDESPASATEYYLWLMERDRKVTPLKALQGLVWERGFASGELQSVVFDDVPPAFARWRNAGKKIAIYSSGSVLAQQNVFRHSKHGDLTRFIDAYFDTQVGAKRDPASYETIARLLQQDLCDVLFVSDSVDELNSAAAGRCQTMMCVRPGNVTATVAHAHKTIQTFEEIP